jgi:hypothetical protein
MEVKAARLHEKIRPVCQRCCCAQWENGQLFLTVPESIMPYNSFGAPSSAVAVISLGAHKCWWGESRGEQVFAVQKRAAPLRVLWRNYAINTNVSN